MKPQIRLKFYSVKIAKQDREQSVAVRTRAYADKVDHKIKNSQNCFLSVLCLTVDIMLDLSFEGAKAHKEDVGFSKIQINQTN